MSDYVGAFSAGTLGYISGDAKASYKAFKLTLAYLKRKRKMVTTRSQSLANTKRRHSDYLTIGGAGVSSINMLAQRASVKYTGRGNVKSIQGSSKYVKVSASLRAKVKKVIRKEAGHGVYHTTRQGSLALNNPSPTGMSRSIVSQGGYLAEIVATAPGLDAEYGDNRWWQQSLFVNETFRNGDEFQYFTPLKFLDAASVLWNQKNMTFTYGNQAGNFTNSVAIATGVPIEGSTATPDKKGVDLHVINSYVTWEMKNNSQRLVQLEIYHCVPKVKHPDNLPLETLNGAINAMQQSSATGGVLLSNLNDNVLDTLMANPSLEPKHVEAFNSVYKYEKVTITIAPGEVFKHSIQGPKNMDINFSKLYQGTTDYSGKMWNQSSLCALVAIKPDLVYATGGAGGTSTVGTGRFSARGLSSGTDLKDMISLEVKEVFKMSMPDDTGFIQQTTVAGDVQMLSLKRKVKGYANFTALISATGLDYDAYDEENPGVQIPMSATS